LTVRIAAIVLSRSRGLGGLTIRPVLMADPNKLNDTTVEPATPEWPSLRGIEMRFAHLKRILRLGRLRLRGPRGAQDEFVLAAIAQNLRRLAKLVTNPPLIVPHAAPT
jgi:hypothetical protein